jgi:coenzyme F420-reducing hydrogenase alpha subunit
MATKATIHVHHVTRVEGHGDISAEIVDGRLKHVRFAVVEAPRFFEGIVRGYSYSDVCHIASRICGICACSHRCAALKATEVALGVTISPQTDMLRRLAFHGEVLSSHFLHILFLVAPDFLGLPSVMPLIATDPGLVKRAMRLKQLGYDLAAMVAGRHTHPVAMTVGGFSFMLDPADVRVMRKRLLDIHEDVDAIVDLFSTITLPDFGRPREYVSLKHPDRYALYDGDIFSSDGHRLPVRRYLEATNECVAPYSTAKHARITWSERWRASTTISSSSTRPPSRWPRVWGWRHPCTTPSPSPWPSLSSAYTASRTPSSCATASSRTAWIRRSCRRR